MSAWRLKECYILTPSLSSHSQDRVQEDLPEPIAGTVRSGLQKIRPGRNGEDQLQGVLRNDEPEEVIYGRIGEKTMHANPDNKFV